MDRLVKQNQIGIHACRHSALPVPAHHSGRGGRGHPHRIAQRNARLVCHGADQPIGGTHTARETRPIGHERHPLLDIHPLAVAQAAEDTLPFRHARPPHRIRYQHQVFRPLGLIGQLQQGGRQMAAVGNQLGPHPLDEIRALHHAGHTEALMPGDGGHAAVQMGDQAKSVFVGLQHILIGRGGVGDGRHNPLPAQKRAERRRSRQLRGRAPSQDSPIGPLRDAAVIPRRRMAQIFFILRPLVFRRKVRPFQMQSRHPGPLVIGVLHLPVRLKGLL